MLIRSLFNLNESGRWGVVMGWLGGAWGWGDWGDWGESVEAHCEKVCLAVMLVR